VSDDVHRESRAAGLRGPGAGAVPVRAPDDDHLRHNPVQEMLAEVHGVSQPTVSRVIAVCTPLIARALEERAPAAEDLWTPLPN